jgi:hypothetical protein
MKVCRWTTAVAALFIFANCAVSGSEGNTPGWWRSKDVIDVQCKPKFLVFIVFFQVVDSAAWGDIARSVVAEALAEVRRNRFVRLMVTGHQDHPTPREIVRQRTVTTKLEILRLGVGARDIEVRPNLSGIGDCHLHRNEAKVLIFY